MTIINIPDELVVEVTADDIRNGKPTNNCECPVALALKRLPGVAAGSAWVDFTHAEVKYTVGGETFDLVFSLPREAAGFIEAFDFGDPVEPVTFTAELQEWS